eukprot:547226-Prorocentrum_minimum.AAC.1
MLSPEEQRARQVGGAARVRVDEAVFASKDVREEMGRIEFFSSKRTYQGTVINGQFSLAESPPPVRDSDPLCFDFDLIQRSNKARRPGCHEGRVSATILCSLVPGGGSEPQGGAGDTWCSGIPGGDS